MLGENSSYWALITVKNGENTILQSLESILQQSVPPLLLVVVDDGSVDATPRILKSLNYPGRVIRVITLPDRGYDIRRIVHNWNVACDYVRTNRQDYDYMLISSDDVGFPVDYVSSLISEMQKDAKLVVASGSRGLEQNDFISLPEGAGRLVRSSFFKELGFNYPPYYGYEPWILYKALQLGYNVKKFRHVAYEHKRAFGVSHKFIEYGPAMRCLGYHPAFVLARVARNFISTKTGISRKASIRMLFDFLFESRWKNDPYFHYFEPELRNFVRNMQVKRLLFRLQEL